MKGKARESRETNFDYPGKYADAESIEDKEIVVSQFRSLLHTAMSTRPPTRTSTTRATSRPPSRTGTATSRTSASELQGDWVVAVLEGRGVGREVGVVAIERDLGKVVITQVRSTRLRGEGEELTRSAVLGHACFRQDAPPPHLATSLSHSRPLLLSRERELGTAWKGKRGGARTNRSERRGHRPRQELAGGVEGSHDDWGAAQVLERAEW
mgnify:FL=1